jgi:hypothetical protein
LLEGLEGQLAAGRPGRPVNRFQGSALRGPCGVTVDPVGLA